MLRRPPTVISLRPADVNDMKALVEARQLAANEATGKGKGKDVDGDGDAVLDRETAERNEKEKRSRADRIGA